MKAPNTQEPKKEPCQPPEDAELRTPVCLYCNQEAEIDRLKAKVKSQATHILTQSKELAEALKNAPANNSAGASEE